MVQERRRRRWQRIEWPYLLVMWNYAHRHVQVPSSKCHANNVGQNITGKLRNTILREQAQAPLCLDNRCGMNLKDIRQEFEMAVHIVALLCDGPTAAGLLNLFVNDVFGACFGG